MLRSCCERCGILAVLVCRDRPRGDARSNIARRLVHIIIWLPVQMLYTLDGCPHGRMNYLRAIDRGG